jgi:hypothetical protein
MSEESNEPVRFPHFVVEALEKMPPRAKRAKIHCNACGDTTNHDVLASDDNKDRYGYLHRFEMMKCRGCGGVTMRDTTYISKHKDDWQIVQYPPAEPRRRPEWMDGGLDSDDVWELVYQIYVATQNGL